MVMIVAEFLIMASSFAVIFMILLCMIHSDIDSDRKYRKMFGPYRPRRQKNGAGAGAGAGGKKSGCRHRRSV